MVQILHLGVLNDSHPPRTGQFSLYLVVPEVRVGMGSSCGVSPAYIGNLNVGSLPSFLASRFLAVITMVLHQSVGVPIGTGLMMPLLISSQRASFTCSLS